MRENALRALSEESLDAANELVVRERLLQETRSVLAELLGAASGQRGARNEQEADVWVPGAQLLVEAEAAEARHEDIRHHEMNGRAVLAYGNDRVLAVGGLDHVVPAR